MSCGLRFMCAGAHYGAQSYVARVCDFLGGSTSASSAAAHHTQISRMAAGAEAAAIAELLDTRLRVDLQRVHDERDALHERVSDWCAHPSPRAPTSAAPTPMPCARRADAHDRRASCRSLELRNNVTMLLDAKQTKLKTMVNLGSDFYVQARVPDTSSLYVNVGLGFHAQMTLEEAAAFSSQREAALSAAADALTDRAARLKARIKLAASAVDELQRQQGARRDEAG